MSYAQRRRLQCINGCDADRFEALNAPVFVDGGGHLVEFDATRATFVCAMCGSVALDIAAAARQMSEQEEAEVQPITCPSCGTEMLPPEDDPLAELVECPMCGQRFTTDEGRRGLLGEVRPSGDPELN